MKKLDPKIVMQEVIELSKNGIAPSTTRVKSKYHKLVAEFGSWEKACKEMGLKPHSKSRPNQKKRTRKSVKYEKGDLLRALYGVSSMAQATDQARGWLQEAGHREEGVRRLGIR